MGDASRSASATAPARGLSPRRGCRQPMEGRLLPTVVRSLVGIGEGQDRLGQKVYELMSKRKVNTFPKQKMARPSIVHVFFGRGTRLLTLHVQKKKILADLLRRRCCGPGARRKRRQSLQEVRSQAEPGNERVVGRGLDQLLARACAVVWPIVSPVGKFHHIHRKVNSLGAGHRRRVPLLRAWSRARRRVRRRRTRGRAPLLGTRERSFLLHLCGNRAHLSSSAVGSHRWESLRGRRFLGTPSQSGIRIRSRSGKPRCAHVRRRRRMRSAPRRRVRPR